MMTSAAVGELAADMLLGRSPDWADVAQTAPARFDFPRCLSIDFAINRFT
jgi:glycine/D-amino acid oxidase-like deaminating enzyme